MKGEARASLKLDTSHGNVGRDTGPIGKEPRKSKSSVKNRQAPPKRNKRKGRLSALPTLPLDVLYEIFAHLGPGDLLHLARTTKAFRSLLLTRRSLSLWKEVLDVSAANGDPVKPDDMSEIAWTALIFGKPWCTMCGGRTSNPVLWALQMRPCTACVLKHLYSDANRGLVSFGAPLTHVLHYPSPSLKTKRWQYAYRKTDYNGYRLKLQDLHARFPDEAKFEEQRGLLNQDLRRALDARGEWARACHARERAKEKDRSNEMESIRAQRLEDIKSRLRLQGFEDRDLDSLSFRHEPNVRASKPLTDSSWAKIAPGVTSCAECVRDHRLQRESLQRRKDREDVVGCAYLEFLKKIQSTTISFMPSLSVILGLPRISNAIRKDTPASNHLQRIVGDALALSWSDIVQRINKQALQLRYKVPDGWVRRSCTLRATPTLSVESTLRSLDLVSHVWTCGGCTEPHILYGLDALAHTSLLSGGELNSHISPSSRAHLAIMQLLALLGLDPEETTVGDMRRIANSKLFICPKCDHNRERPMLCHSWTSAVSHAGRSPHDGPFLGPAEFTLVKLDPLQERSALQRAWGCCHCTFHLKLATTRSEQHLQTAGPWPQLVELKQHLEQSHGIQEGVEGIDYFFNRQNPRAIEEKGIPVPTKDIVEAVELLEGTATEQNVV
ncbi:unnamed protein product [Peniophora sp. CBMAI 1063]|nr:unnamed protein product [Peniophora sp. CBMAI 1063]